MFKSKILFTSGLIMSVVAVVLLVVSGFNFKDLKPANWGNITKVYAASNGTIKGSEEITQARGYKVSSCDRLDAAYIYLGPSKITRTLTYTPISGAPFTWHEIYTVNAGDWINESTTNDTSNTNNMFDYIHWYSTGANNDWYGYAYNIVRINGSNSYNFAGGTLQCSYSPGDTIIFNNGLYSAAEGGDKFYSFPKKWTISVTDLPQ